MAVLVACTERQEEHVFTQDGQEFRIVSAYEGHAAYLEAYRGDPGADVQVLWREHVVEPYREGCVGEGEFAELADKLAEDPFAEPMLDFERLSEAEDVLADSEIERIVERTLRDSAAKLPGPDTTVCVFVASDRRANFMRSVEEIVGVGGFAASAGNIWLFVQPEEDWEGWMPNVVAHEYHHSVWTERYYDASREYELIDNLVFEGKADSFARLLYPDKVAPHTEALTPTQEAEQWDAMQDELDSTSFKTHRRYIFGLEEVPLWTGYTIGFRIVQSYLANHPDASVEEWTALEAREMLEESGYTGR